MSKRRKNGGTHRIDTVARRDRDHQALVLRRQGLTYNEVAQEMGMRDKATAFRAVERAMNRIEAPDVEHLRAVENQKLDVLERRCWDALRAEQEILANWREPAQIVAELLDKGAERDDIIKAVARGSENRRRQTESMMKIVDRLTRITERRARLNGLDAPVEAHIDTTGSITVEISPKLTTVKGMDQPELVIDQDGNVEKTQ